MGIEINLLEKYPKTKRDINSRKNMKTLDHQNIARKFDREFFDGDRTTGYGGYYYNIIYWDKVVEDFINFYDLSDNSRILDIGCGKGFMLYDFKRKLNNISISGIDISKYAIENSLEEVKEHLTVGNATSLPFDDNYFDLVISITTIHNLQNKELKKSLTEISRVSKKNAFITVDAYRDEIEKKIMFDWNLTAKTILHVEDWKNLFSETRYTGDYYWFTP
jgi:SAM-dependent methyltransferase